MIDSKNRRSRANQTIAGKGISMVSFVQNLSLLYVFFFFFLNRKARQMKRLPFHVLFKRVLEEKTQPVVWRYVLCRVFMRLEEKKSRCLALLLTGFISLFS